jgi:hypothetical protein
VILAPGPSSEDWAGAALYPTYRQTVRPAVHRLRQLEEAAWLIRGRLSLFLEVSHYFLAFDGPEINLGQVVSRCPAIDRGLPCADTTPLVIKAGPTSGQSLRRLPCSPVHLTDLCRRCRSGRVVAGSDLVVIDLLAPLVAVDDLRAPSRVRLDFVVVLAIRICAARLAPSSRSQNGPMTQCR